MLTTLLHDLAPEILAFGERQGILDTLRISLQLVQEYFPDARRISAELVYDPDARDEWVALDVDVPASVPELMARDDAFLDRWLQEVGWPEVGKLVVMVYPAADDGCA